MGDDAGWAPRGEWGEAEAPERGVHRPATIEVTGTDGLIGVYAARAAGRGVDLRPAINAHRARVSGQVGRESPPRVEQPRPNPPTIQSIGRGTAAHRAAVRADRRATRARGLGRPGRDGARPSALAALLGMLGGGPRRRRAGGRRLVTAGCVAGLILVGGGGAGAAARNEVATWQQRDRSQPGAAAAGLAAAQDGTGAFALDGHLVAAGETVAIIAAGYGLSPQTLASLNGLDEPEVIEVGQLLLIPARDRGADPLPATLDRESAAGGGVASAAATGLTATPTEAFVTGVPTHVQERNLSCEYAAAFIATGAFGAGIPESVFLDNVPPARNPHRGYRGNIDGWWGNTDDYGVYPEALLPTLEAYGFAAEVLYTTGDPEPLRRQIAAGRPVATWLGFWGDTGLTFADEGLYTVAAGVHVVVVYGYDAGGVYVSNPARGEYGYYAWDDFTAMWSVLDGMSLAVSPA